MRAGVLLVLAGCLQPSEVACGDFVCPPNLACDVAHHLCVSPDQLAACTGVGDGSPCATKTIAAGFCIGGTCLPQVCGDAIVEPGEQCDPPSPGHGCSADCTSNETCGNGIVDAITGEQCDDGNTHSRDGCSARCTFEDRQWNVRLAQLPARKSTAVAYDLARGALVVFGGVDVNTNTLLGDTWEWNGQRWTDVTPPGLSPPAREAAGWAYDPVRHRVVLFGGVSGSLGLLDDTWEWDGITWQRARPAATPQARAAHAMGWDGHAIVIVNGSTLLHAVGDAWRWDGRTWTQLVTPALGFGARFGGALAFDAAHDRGVLVGGQLSNGNRPSSFAFDDTTWTQLSSVPPIFSSCAAAYDAARGVTIVLGINLVTKAFETWELVGTAWHSLAPTSSPDLDDGFAVAFDLAHRTVLAIGAKGSVGEVWSYDGTTWTRVDTLPVDPGPRQEAAMASFPTRGRVVMYGGEHVPSAFDPSQVYFDDTWEWDGLAWAPVASGTPPARFNTAMAFDGTRVVLFGGEGPTTIADGLTWLWDGAQWTSVAGGPSPRAAPAMAYDARRGRVVLFGGRDRSGLRSDTWEWDGQAETWTAIVVPGPPARQGGGMAYDIARGVVVLFGGKDPSANLLADTWEWDGQTWVGVVPATTPEGRIQHTLVYDRARERVALFGGFASDFSPWEWDGVAWTHETPTRQPPGAVGVAAAYDDARAQIVSFGGSIAIGDTNETWTGTYIGSPEETCTAGVDLNGNGLAGCADPDCAFACAPACLLGPPCAAPTCGDGACDGLETDRTCPADCAPAPALCGDGWCAPGEAATCPADC